ncbi:MAG TPA: GNAT family N-acetyltransferase, partial [Dehalococcoidia bacterium]|nr:GNAT family N-acetyltransferase [Dehalococcoidia bacterium]
MLAALRVYGPLDVFKLLQVARADRRVQTDRPAGEYHVSELHVDSRYRNRGIGAALLRYAEEDAREGGHRLMSLQVLTSNPA